MRRSTGAAGRAWTSLVAARGGLLSVGVDGAVAATVLIVFWLPSLLTMTDGVRVAVGWALTWMVAGSLVLRWRLPMMSVTISVAGTLAGWMVGASADPMLAAAWCLYPLAAKQTSRTSSVALAAIGGMVVLASVVAVPEGGAAWGQRVLVAAAAIGAGWLLGQVEGRRVDAVRALEQARFERARSEQELAVARDVHDVVGHALGVISAEAGVARILPDTDEEELRESLGSIERRARSALVDVQGLVRSLRSGRVPSRVALGSLAEVMAAARSTGLRVESDLDAGGLSPEVEEAATRLVQEAVSNVVRHAHATSCRVSVTACDDELRVSVEDDGRGRAPGAEPGFGIAGMRERVEKAGGTIVWSARDGGGTAVRVRLPLGVGP